MKTKNRSIKYKVILALLLAFSNSNISANNNTQIVDLKVEYQKQPIGIDVDKPRFSWRMESGETGQKQIAYQIIVSSDEGNGDIWDSGKQHSDKSVGIKYDGNPLNPSNRYYWIVNVWDANEDLIKSDESWFETGLLSEDGITNWDGAKWITIDNTIKNYTYQSEITLPLSDDSTYTSLIFSYKNSENYFFWRFSRDETGNICFQPKALVNSVEYPIVGASYDVSETPGAVKTDINKNKVHVKIEFDSEQNIIKTHLDNSIFLTILDYKGYSEVPINRTGNLGFPSAPSIIDLPPLRNGNVGVQFSRSNTGQTYYSARLDNIQVVVDSVVEFEEDFSFENKLTGGRLENGELVLTLNDIENEIFVIRSDFKGLTAPMLRKEKSLINDKKIKDAKLYISALGVFDAFINGKRIGIINEDESVSYEFMNPGWTSYESNVNYLSYDVTNYITGSDLTIAAMLGNGWFNSRMVADGSKYYSPGGNNDLGILAKLLITYTDNTTQTIITDDTWKATDTGPVRLNDLYDGETYDATLEIEGWNDNGFDDGSWNGVREHSYLKDFPNAKVTAMQGKNVYIVDELDQKPISATTYHGIINVGDTTKVKNGLGEINLIEDKTTKNSTAAKEPMTLLPSETIIYDLGQNMVGVPKITFHGDAGTTIRMRFSEMINDESLPNGSRGADGPQGTIYVKNLRSAKVTDYYTLKGGKEETFQPRFTFHGFRYLEVSIVSGTKTVVSDVTGKVITSAIEQTGFIETSNADINKLFNSIIWGQRGNYLSIPTDCPQRDERLGWSGDTQVFCNTGLYNFNSFIFLEAFEDLLALAQHVYFNDGGFGCVVPPAQAIRGMDSGWADAGIIVPWTIWQMSGDITVVEKYYSNMVKYMDAIYEQTGTTYKGPGTLFGDWLAFQGTNNQLMSDAYYAYDAKLMADMAMAIDRNDDVLKYNTLFENIKSTFIKNYIEKSSGENPMLSVKSGIDRVVDQESYTRRGINLEDNTQTALLWCLKLGLYEDDSQKEQLIDLLVGNISNSDEYKTLTPSTSRVNYAANTLSVGFLGINVLNPVLSDNGQSSLAYSLLLQDKLPSWLFEIQNGATTIWERWNSYSLTDGFGDSGMNSYNHYAYAAVGEWMYKYMLGIMYDKNNPGFKHIILQPTIDESKRISWINGSYESPYGFIKVNWDFNEDNDLKYDVTIPANTSATLYLPLIDNIHDFSSSLGANYSGNSMRNGVDVATYELSSGSFEFQMVDSSVRVKTY